MHRAAPARGRGGPRPGSACPERSRGGPPPGNLNAYKHGRTSRQHKRLLQLIARDRRPTSSFSTSPDATAAASTPLTPTRTG